MMYLKSPVAVMQWLAVCVFNLFIATQVSAGSWQAAAAIGGFERVHIYTPDSESPVGEGKALLIVLHGCVQPIDNFLSANLEQAAESAGMVIAVPDAMHKQLANCWAFWEKDVARDSGDYKHLISLAEIMTADAARGIDAKQVYITGVSSGGVFAAQTGCVAPDIFAATATAAAPSIGISPKGALRNCEVVSPATFKARCEGYAGDNKSYLASQIAVVAHGTEDALVDKCYNEQNARGFAEVYGVERLSGVEIESDGLGHTADASRWQNNRVSMLWLNNLAHTWSGGAGASGAYIGSESVNFAAYIGDYFAKHNLRVERSSSRTKPKVAAVSSQSLLENDSEG